MAEWRRVRCDGPDTVAAHQSLDATAARPAALSSQLGIDARAAIGVAVNPLDVVNEFTVGGSRALRRSQLAVDPAHQPIGKCTMVTPPEA
jgi:hypothetical protein